ncbi:MAG: CotH kinase family protein [Clostridia bacterium]|nr:CotH kinase family protein [Clostridia bacterium]
MSFGGGRGNGGGFDIEKFRVKEENGESAKTETETTTPGTTAAPETGTQPAAPADADGNGGSFGGSSGRQNGDGASSGMPQGTDSGMPAGMPGGDFAASNGGSAGATDTAIPEGSALPDGGSTARNGRGTPPEMPGDGDFGGFGFGGFNFGMGSGDVKLVYSDDNPDSYSNIFNNAKTDIRMKDKIRLIESIRKLNAKEDIESVVDTDEVTRYLAVHNFLCNDDSYTGMMVHNYYLYEEKGKLSIIPWDYNLGFGGFSASTNATSTVNSPIDSPVSGGTTDSRPLIAWIFQDEEALKAYHEAYDRFISENVETGWMAAEISRVQEMITPYLENDPTAFYTMDEFTKAVETLQTFCAKRGESIRGQLDGAIPSTSEGQRTSSALIDASEISTADMGSMNGAGGAPGGMPGGGGGFSMPDMSGGGGFTMPKGMKMPEGMTVPGGTGDMGGSFDGSAGKQAGSTEAAEAPVTAGPETTAKPAEKAAEGETTEKPAESSRPERPSGMPEGMNFPGMEGTQADQSGLWIQAAVWSAVLLAALLIIRRAGFHNQ